MSDFKFLHASDIHLDSPLRGLSRYEGLPSDRIRLATREALENLVDTAIEEGVSFVIIAGDLYDGDWEHFGTGLFFCAAMRRLGDASIAVYLLYGNHDADSVLTKKLPLPPNVHVFGHRKAQYFDDEASGAVLHGRSYRSRDPGENLAASYLPAVAGKFNIGVLHTALTGGRPPHAPYSPCSPGDLSAKGYDYWALGHVHAFEVVAADPYIVFSGNIQGRSIRETGAKGAALVSVQDGTISNVRFVELDAVRWASVGVDVSNSTAEHEIHAVIRAALANAIAENDQKRLIVRVTLTGDQSDGASQYGENFREDVRAIAIGLSDSLWIEKVYIRTVQKRADGPSQVQQSDITSLFDAGVSDAGLRQALESEFLDFASRVPSDLGAESGLLSQVRSSKFDEILQEAANALRARLLTQGS